MLRAVLILLLLVSINSCDLPQVEGNSLTPTKQSLANEVSNKTIAQLKKENELYACGIGSGMMDQIRMLALSFNYYKEADINQARALLMTAGTVFLNTINANTQIRNYLKNFPFKQENIEIQIFLKEPNRLKHDADKLIVVSLLDGILKYQVRSSQTDRLTTIYQETFEEATAKLSNTESLNPSM